MNTMKQARKNAKLARARRQKKPLSRQERIAINRAWRAGQTAAKQARAQALAAARAKGRQFLANLKGK